MSPPTSDTEPAERPPERLEPGLSLLEPCAPLLEPCAPLLEPGAPLLEPCAPLTVASIIAEERHRMWKAGQAARPKLRGWLHAAALPLVAAGGTALTLRVRDRKARVGLFVFGGGYSAMLAASASYHRLPRSERQAHWLRRVDHSMIYVAEAATVTPLAVILLPPPLSGLVIGGAWTVAGVGATLKMTRLNEERDGGSWLYLAIGWAAVAMAPLVYRRGGKGALVAMAAGGVLYSGGFAVLAKQRPNPAPGVFGYHEVWHALVLAAGLAHAEMLRRVVVGSRDQ